MPPKRKADEEKKLRLTMDEKFWEITMSGSSTTVVFGKIGSGGQTQAKDHGNAAAAQKFFDKMVNEKKKKGYSEGSDGGGDEGEDDESGDEAGAVSTAKFMAGPAKKKAKTAGKLRLVMDEKFWEISMEGSSTTVTFGKIDSKGQTQTKDHGTADKAQKAYDKLVNEKRKKGYEDDEDGDDDDDDDDDDDEDGNGEFNEEEFWDEETEPCSAEITDKIIKEVEEKCGGYKLPPSYVDSLKKTQNGGRPKRTCFKFSDEEGDLETAETIFGIGGEDESNSLASERANYVDEWEYPDVGLYFADTQTGGHTMWCLHYGKCGKELKGGKEPRVVLIDQEDDYSIKETGCNFGEFIRKLCEEEED